MLTTLPYVAPCGNAMCTACCDGRVVLLQEHGRFYSIEWAAGHSDAGMGACGSALKVVYVTAC